MIENKLVCEHGSLRDKCEICERNEIIAEQAETIRHLKDIGREIHYELAAEKAARVKMEKQCEQLKEHILSAAPLVWMGAEGTYEEHAYKWEKKAMELCEESGE